MGDLVALLGDVMVEADVTAVLHLLLERMTNEITRVVSLQTVGKIAKSPLKLDMACILADATEELANFLRQHSRSLKMESLQVISALIQSNSSKISDPLFTLILTEAAPLISDGDLQVRPRERKKSWGCPTTDANKCASGAGGRSGRSRQ
jgi:cullin-associated NEDD8-dissociated protein 1